MTLVQIPWQPVYWLTPHTLNLLDKASDLLGTRLYLYTGDPRGLLSAWRSYQQQKLLYEAFLNGGTLASSPDVGPRMHMRGGAFDLVRQDTTARNACKAVGLIPDPTEAWHWNDPLGTSMPIIETNTATSGGDISPLIEGAAMDYRQIKTLGDPATFADTTGLVVQRGLSSTQAAVRRSGRNVKYIQRKVGESSKAWDARKASILAYWDAEAAANVAAVKAP